MTDVEKLIAAFNNTFPDAPAPRVCRAPGRVNLIGEHTDYNGLPVLPMTIDRDVAVAFAPRPDSTIRLRSSTHDYPEREFVNGPDIVPSEGGIWDNYCKAAVQGLNHHFDVSRFPGMDMCVAGDIPTAVGLSSSSALVVACALAYLALLGKTLESDITRLELAELAADAERYVGTRGGGMDQAIILLGDKGAACKIDFYPLRAERVSLPQDGAIVICNSLVKAAKSGNMLHRYNEGPLTCRLIRAMVEKHLQEHWDPEIEINCLGALWNGMLCLTDREAESVFEQTFPGKTTTLSEAGTFLGLSPEAIRERWLEDLEEPKEGFRLKARARHQRTEYRRVESARDMMLAGDAAALGELMNASHQSCAEDYRISCPELDTLVALARQEGALGARLTGAGFGGCTVNLVPAGEVERFCESIEHAYYRERLAQQTSVPRRDYILRAETSPAADYI